MKLKKKQKSERCVVCDRKIKVMCQKNTPYCSQNCDKRAQGDPTVVT